MAFRLQERQYVCINVDTGDGGAANAGGVFCWQLQRCLSEITECCKTGEGNLLELSIDAARARATVGEITDAMETVFGRHVATSRLVSGAYKTEYGDMDELTNVSKRIEVGTHLP